MNNFHAALEICSVGVKLLVGYYYNGQVYVLHALSSTESKTTNGYIDDIKSTALAIKEVVNIAQNQLNSKIESISLCIPPVDLLVKSDSANTSTVNVDSKISNSDINNLYNMLTKKVSEPNKKIISILPTKYHTDDGHIYKELPSNCQTNELSLDADCHLVDEVVYDTYRQACEQAGVKVSLALVSPFATIKLLDSYKEIPMEYLLVDIGHKTTTISSAFENRLIASETFGFGGYHIIKAVAKEFDISLERATYYVHTFGMSKDPSFEFVTPENFKISQLDAVIKKTLSSLINGIKNAATHFQMEEIGTIILSGGGSNLNGIDLFISEAFATNVFVFTPRNFGARNKSFTNLIGLIKYTSTNPPRNYQKKNNDFTLTRVGIPIPDDRENTDDDESL